MGLLAEPALPDSFAPYVALRQHFGFVPAIFRAQSLLPRLIEAEARIASAVLLAPGALRRTQKETVLLTLAARHGNVYCVTAHRHVLQQLGVSTNRLDVLTANYREAGLAPAEAALLDVAHKLGGDTGTIHQGDIDGLRAHGFSDEQILEVILMTALTRFLCTLSSGLSVEPDFIPQPVPDLSDQHPVDADPAWATAGPYLRVIEREIPPFAFFRNAFGFVPNIFRAQTMRPDVLDAEAFAVGAVLLTTDILSRAQKEFILLVISAANLNTYCVAVHCEMLRALGVAEEVSDQIAVDHHNADLSPADKVLLDFALHVARGLSPGPRDLELLRTHGFSDWHILEAVAMSSLTIFLNTLQSGLGTVPDFVPRRVFAAPVTPTADAAHPTDPDMQLVDRARQGDVGAFEELVRRHHHRILRAAYGVTGNREDAEDAAQVAFVKAFENLQTFERHARFTTWLTRIAINEALSRVRARKPMENLSLERDEGREFRPAVVEAWVDSPEKLYAREELRSIIERALADIPVPYRMAVLLRDVEQLSTVEAASALGLPVPTLKKHLMRGRLMLRESLAPHFISQRGAVHSV
jgi:RNA polymerase sigma-70 factor, ECF subfamily